MGDNYVVLDTSCEQIPSFVGQYQRFPNEKRPKIVVIDSLSPLTRTEKIVSDFYKCTVNWPLNGAKETVDTSTVPEEKKKCFATRQTTVYFEMHLREKHRNVFQFFCVYCYDALEKSGQLSYLKTYPYNYLLKHMWKRHRFRRFQCNLCLYRAISEDHVVLHQRKHHLFEYSANSVKVLVCPQMTDQTRNLFFYWNKYKAKRLNSEGKNESSFQCLYCEHSVHEDLRTVIDHCVEKHPDYPLLYYMPEPHVSSSSYTLVELTPSSIYEKMVVIPPKLEPQDNSISSTQRSPESVISVISETNDRRRGISPEKDGSHPKRMRADSSGSAINEIESQNLLTEESIIEKKIICLFCEQTFVDISDAKSHLKEHINTNSPQEDRQVSEWIQTFLQKQWSLCSFTDCPSFASARRSLRAYYYCPICVSLGTLHRRYAKHYEEFSEVRNHFLEHCCWLSAKCRICKKSFANYDSIITQHFNDDSLSGVHLAIRQMPKFQFLLTDEDITFNSQQRKDLEKKCIEVKCIEQIDKWIHRKLDQIKDTIVEELKLKYKCNLKASLKVERLSDNKFAKYFDEYQEYEKRKPTQVCEDSEESQSLRSNGSKERDKNENKKGSKKSNKSKETSGHRKGANRERRTNAQRGHKSNDTTPHNSLQESSHTMSSSANTSDESLIPRRLSSTESRGNEIRCSDTEASVDEEFARIACYHCTDKFKSKREFKEHSKTKHPNLPLRMYAKPRKTE